MTWKEKMMQGMAWHYSKTIEKTACGIDAHEFIYSTRVLRKVNCYRCLKTKSYKMAKIAKEKRI